MEYEYITTDCVMQSESSYIMSTGAEPCAATLAGFRAARAKRINEMRHYSHTPGITTLADHSK